LAYPLFKGPPLLRHFTCFLIPFLVDYNYLLSEKKDEERVETSKKKTKNRNDYKKIIKKGDSSKKRSAKEKEVEKNKLEDKKNERKNMGGLEYGTFLEDEDGLSFQTSLLQSPLQVSLISLTLLSSSHNDVELCGCKYALKGEFTSAVSFPCDEYDVKRVKGEGKWSPWKTCRVVFFKFFRPVAFGIIIK
jgi:hypothetical protein